MTLIHYKSGRTQEELLEIAKRHEEGASVLDDVASSEPEAKDHDRVLTNQLKVSMIYLQKIILNKEKIVIHQGVL